MKKLIITTFILLIISCKGQTEKNTSNKKTNTMEKFDINKFNKLEKDDEYLTTEDEFFYKLNEKRFKVLLYEEIDVEETDINSPNLFYKVYFRKSKQLKSVGKLFYSIPIGISKEYSEKGELLKEIDHEKDYKFNIDDLQKKMKQDYDVDIMDKKQTRSVGRTVNYPGIKFPYYSVVVNSGIGKFTSYLLNGNTGEVFYTLKTIRGEEKVTVEEYLKSLKK